MATPADFVATRVRLIPTSAPDLLKRAKKVAADERTTLRALIDEGLRAALDGAGLRGPRRLIAVDSNWVSELWSADRDFGRFPELKVTNPLLP